MRDFFAEHFTECKVFKLGTGQLKVYIVGRTEKGEWLGLETDALET